jgi:hypothetical protein
MQRMPHRYGDIDWMDFRRLSLFLRVAEAGSFSRAAAVLAIPDHSPGSPG